MTTGEQPFQFLVVRDREIEELHAEIERLRTLIAAAPDLADVVRNIAGIVVRNIAGIDDGWLQDAHANLLRKAIIDIRDEARAAIAKAEGAS